MAHISTNKITLWRPWNLFISIHFHTVGFISNFFPDIYIYIYSITLISEIFFKYQKTEKNKEINNGRMKKENTKVPLQII